MRVSQASGQDERLHSVCAAGGKVARPGVVHGQQGKGAGFQRVVRPVFEQLDGGLRVFLVPVGIPFGRTSSKLPWMADLGGLDQEAIFSKRSSLHLVRVCWHRARRQIRQHLVPRWEQSLRG